MATRPMAISPPGTKIGARKTGSAGKGNDAGSGSASQSARVLMKKAAPQQPTYHPASLAEATGVYSLGFERALEMGNALLSASVCMHSCLMEFYEDVLSCVPPFAAQFEMAAKLVAICTEQQFHLLRLCSPALWLPTAGRRTASASAGVLPSGKLVRMEEKIRKEAIELEREVLETEAEILEHSMDIAIGACAA